jgi:alkanesulfonate monooxygenase SsuD/methylene tetrahydromethanopterin reductase-like flavin-dependent oxidoreductase (luciferase family)
MTRAQLGVCFDRSFPPSSIVEFTERVESGGLDQIWVIEDCFYTAAISLAATALARTDRTTVGIGILPAVARNPAITAMEIATLANLAPGRLIAGIGHGVQHWMAQMGARPTSPLAMLEEVLTVVRQLLRGDSVTFHGTAVRMDSVQLDQPPAKLPPVVAGVRGPKSMAVAGRAADGVVLAEGAGPGYIAAACEQAGEPSLFRVSVFSALCIEPERAAAYRWMAPVVAGWLSGPNPAIDHHSHAEELHARFADGGVDALATMPRDWWLQLGAIGTFDDAVEHLYGLANAGAHDIALFPCPDLQVARAQLDDAVKLANALR